MKLTGPSIFAATPRSLWRRAAVVAAVLLVVMLSVLVFRPVPRPEVILLPSDYSIQASPLPLPDRWIPRTWAWLWKLRYALLGKPATIEIATDLILFREPGCPPDPRILEGRKPLDSTNGVRGWVLSESEMKLLDDQLEPQYDNEHRNYPVIVQPDEPFAESPPGLPTYQRRRSHTTMGAGVLTTLKMPTPRTIKGVPFTTGDTINYAVRLRGDVIELTASLTSVEMVTNTPFRSPDSSEMVHLQTNVALAAKMHVPRGHGVFLFDTNSVGARHLGAGVLIHLKIK